MRLTVRAIVDPVRSAFLAGASMTSGRPNRSMGDW
jgi:hypothetical protein